MNELADGDLILLVDKVGRRHKVRLKAGQRHSLHSGAIEHDALIGRPEGVVVTTQLGARLLAVRPTFAEQVTGRVRWRESILGFRQVGVDTTVECGGGKVLTGMIKRTDRELETISLDTAADIEKFAKTL